MKKELDYFYIGNSYGGNQDWFNSLWMQRGGCAAETVCDTSVFLAMRHGMTHLYPFELPVTKEDYISFADIMRPYLSPRWTGIDKLDIYIDGARDYFYDCGANNIRVLPWAGDNSLSATKEVVKRQLDNDVPIPVLTLKHRHPDMDFYVWHWYLLIGYEEIEYNFRVKAVTYSEAHWLDLDMLWDTGYSRKGGFIIFEWDRL